LTLPAASFFIANIWDSDIIASHHLLRHTDENVHPLFQRSISSWMIVRSKIKEIEDNPWRRIGCIAKAVYKKIAHISNMKRRTLANDALRISVIISVNTGNDVRPMP
jgi:hypothetical protein